MLLIELERKREEAKELLRLSCVGLALMLVFLVVGHDLALIAIPVAAGITLGFITVGTWKYRLATRQLRELKQLAPARLLKR